jgi:hypothetical protein
MIKRAVFARELGVPIVMHDYLTGDSPQILVCLIIAEIMAYFFTSTVQCTLLFSDQRISKKEIETKLLKFSDNKLISFPHSILETKKLKSKKEHKEIYSEVIVVGARRKRRDGRGLDMDYFILNPYHSSRTHRLSAY